MNANRNFNWGKQQQTQSRKYLAQNLDQTD